jgi:orotidine-5'-phosphate decarboxylase
MDRNPVIIALDCSDREQACALARSLAPDAGLFKIGLEMFVRFGPAIVADLAAHGRGIMLDLKLHDIPNTVQRAASNLAALGAELLTVHASGGPAMLAAACEGVRTAASELGRPAPRVLAVTVLTSIDAAMLAHALGVARPVTDQVVSLARMARDAGCDGAVASPHEIAAVRSACGPEFLVVTPGVRPGWAASGDQRRVMTPRAALDAGADYLVIGRPVTAADDPCAALRAIRAELTPGDHAQ